MGSNFSNIKMWVNIVFRFKLRSVSLTKGSFCLLVPEVDVSNQKAGADAGFDLYSNFFSSSPLTQLLVFLMFLFKPMKAAWLIFGWGREGKLKTHWRLCSSDHSRVISAESLWSTQFHKHYSLQSMTILLLDFVPGHRWRKSWSIIPGADDSRSEEQTVLILFGMPSLWHP